MPKRSSRSNTIVIKKQPAPRRPNPAPASRADEGKPRERLAVRRRKRRAALAFAAAFLLLASVGVLGALSHLSRLTVTSVEVDGAVALSPEVVQRAAERTIDDGHRHLFSRANIFLYPRKAIETGLASMPRVSSVSVSRDSLLAQAVRVSIKEREPFALWCGESGSECFTLDATGFIFADAAPLPGAYIFRGGLDENRSPIGQALLSGRLPAMLRIFDLAKEANLSPLGATIENEHDFSIPFAEGFTLRASFGADPEWVAKSLALILASDALAGRANNLDYVDLRFGNKVYYKLKGQAAQSGE